MPQLDNSTQPVDRTLPAANAAVVGGPVRGDRGAVALAPLGLGQQKPHAVVVATQAAWQARAGLGVTVDLLRHGVCDGCSLGPRGLSDDALPGLHLCARRLRGVQDHLRPVLVPADLIDMDRLRRMDAEALRELGRLPAPFSYRRGQRGFSLLSWDQALDRVAQQLRDTPPAHRALVFAPQGQTVETCAALRQAVDRLPLSRAVLARSTAVADAQAALVRTLGSSAASCSVADLTATDLILVFGADPSRSHPDLMRSLAHAKDRGCRVVVVDTQRASGMEMAWTMDSLRSAVLGTRIMDDLVALQPGGQRAFLTALLAVLVQRGAVDRSYIDRFSRGFDALSASLLIQDPHALERVSGASQARVAWVAELVSRARRVVSIYGPGLTEGADGPAALTALARLHVVTGMFGRQGTGMLGLVDAEGCQAALDLGLDGRLAELWGSASPSADLLWMVGDDHHSSLDEVDQQHLEACVSAARTRVHQITFLRPEHLTQSQNPQPQDEIILLPQQTRYQQQGGAVTTSVERRLRFSPEIAGLPVARARPGWWIAAQLLARVDPSQLHSPATQSTQAFRRHIGRSFPRYAGIAALRTSGDHLQWGGPQLFSAGFLDAADGFAQLDPATPS